ncbi:MAG: 3'-5' exonuclease [Desulfobacteraceae bacterium]
MSAYGYDVKKSSDVGILVRGPVSANVVNMSLSTKHRIFENHPLEENFDLWSRLFCQLLKYYFDQSITAQEIIEDSPRSLTSKQARLAGNVIRNIRSIEQNSLFDMFNSIAMILLPNSESEKAKYMLRNSLNDDLSHYFTPAKDDEVQIMTIHKSKGLEFEIVFHLDLYEWAFPGKGPGPGNDFNNPQFHSLEQDVNLHYVAITRAKKACFLCTSTKRIKKKYQSTDLEIKNGSPSEFLLHNSLHNLREVSIL